MVLEAIIINGKKHEITGKSIVRWAVQENSYPGYFEEVIVQAKKILSNVERKRADFLASIKNARDHFNSAYNA